MVDESHATIMHTNMITEEQQHSRRVPQHFKNIEGKKIKESGSSSRKVTIPIRPMG
jgi:hypothetical protein